MKTVWCFQPEDNVHGFESIVSFTHAVCGFAKCAYRYEKCVEAFETQVPKMSGSN